jgi:hypothetical protein
MTLCRKPKDHAWGRWGELESVSRLRPAGGYLGGQLATFKETYDRQSRICDRCGAVDRRRVEP